MHLLFTLNALPVSDFQIFHVY
uniref:Uncharacterized protein n=1 Tax=Rhizophora mucronata TaxID=61149 RepID=A0A2P2N6I6_RHIMU